MTSPDDTQPKKRLTIGLLVDWAEDQYQLNLIYGVEDYLKNIDANFICFEGGSLQSGREYEEHKNLIYELVSEENVDGLIILAATIGHYIENHDVVNFCEQFLPIPTVSVAMKLDMIPSLLVDNSGMKDLIVHLIEVHGYKKFAFITGPGANIDSIQRLRVFRETLMDHNISVDEDLIVEGFFTSESGIEATKILLDDKRGDFEVIIAANDDMALGVLEELHRREVKVPDDLAVVGFDNLDISMFSSPPLTTVSQSMYDQGQKAADIVFQCINGEEVPSISILPTKLINRESCGCFSGIVTEAALGDFPVHDQVFELEFAKNKQMILYEIRKAIEEQGVLNIYVNINEAINKLLDDFYISLLTGQDDSFIKQWNRVVSRILWTRSDVFSWQIVLSEMRKKILPYISEIKMLTRAEDLWHQVRVMISEKVLLEEKFRHHVSVDETKALNWLREELLVTMDEHQLMDVLAERLPRVGITSCYLALYEERKYEASDKARLILAYNEEGRIEIGKSGRLFRSKKLIPDGMLLIKNRFSLLVAPLNLTNEQFGFILFQMGPRNGRIYGALRRIICGTLQGAMLVKKVKAQTSYLKTQKERLTHILVDLRRAMGGFIQTMALTVETRDPYTAGHQRRVADLARAIADEMNLSQELSEGIRMAGIIHDLGKIYVPAEILNKPGRLKDIEFSLIKIHPEVAYDILKSIDFPWPIAAIILQHHERLDGSGYPLGLKGHEIMLEARIICVADVVEAMASHRPYRASLGIDLALDEISKYRGSRYDADVVDACLTLFIKKRFVFRK